MTAVNSSGLEAQTVADLNRGERLYAAFSREMEELCKDGLVDCKMKLLVGNETTPDSVVSTLTNVFRLIKAGKAAPLPYRI